MGRQSGASREIEAVRERDRARQRAEKTNYTTPSRANRAFSITAKRLLFFGGAGKICKTAQRTAISGHTRAHTAPHLQPPPASPLSAPSSRQQKLCYKVKYCADCKLCTKKLQKTAKKTAGGRLTSSGRGRRGECAVYT